MTTWPKMPTANQPELQRFCDGELRYCVRRAQSEKTLSHFTARVHASSRLSQSLHAVATFGAWCWLLLVAACTANAHGLPGRDDGSPDSAIDVGTEGGVDGDRRSDTADAGADTRDAPDASVLDGSESRITDEDVRLIAESWCNLFERCNAQWFEYHHISHEDCVSSEVAARMSWLEATRTSTRYHEHPERVSECIAEQDGADCVLDRDFPIADACALLVRADVVASTGGPCADDSDCDYPRFVCLGGVDVSKCGSCTQPAGLGERCEQGVCTSGLDCVAGSCIRVMEGVACMSEFDCGGRLECPTSTSTTGARTCERPPTEGSPCNAGAGVSCDWRAGLYCIRGSCTRAKLGGAGTPCRDGLRCDDSAFCPLGGTTCVDAPTVGFPCAENSYCTADSYCDSSDTCRTRKVAGETCRTGQCQQGLTCQSYDAQLNGTCAPYMRPRCLR
jgi:hypothetical protein